MGVRTGLGHLQVLTVDFRLMSIYRTWKRGIAVDLAVGRN